MRNLSRIIPVLTVLLLAQLACARLSSVPIASNETQVQSATLAAPTEAIGEVSASPTPAWEEFFAGAQSLAAQGAYAEALDALDQALAISGGNEQIYLLQGQILLATDQYEAALKALSAALSINPESPVAQFTAARVYTKAANYTNALQRFQAAIDLEPNYAPAYRNRAEVHEVLGDYIAAVLDYQIYLALVPNSPERDMLEARILELQGETEEPQAESSLLFLDDFSTQSGAWFGNGDPALALSFEEDALRLVMGSEDTAAWALTERIFSDVAVQVQAQKIGGSDNNFLGAMCRIKGTTSAADFYVFMISSDGFYAIGKRVNNQEKIQLLTGDKLIKSNVIPTDGEPLTLKIECDENRLALFANDILLAEVYDSDLTTGHAGLLVGTYDEAGTDILFDDFQVSSLSQ